MKYYFLNKRESLKDINVNPQILRTKSFAKIEKFKRLSKQIEKLKADIVKELRTSNTRSVPDEWIDRLLTEEVDEITTKDYNALYGMALYDTEIQRITCYSRTENFKGKLIGTEVILDEASQD